MAQAGQDSVPTRDQSLIQGRMVDLGVMARIVRAEALTFVTVLGPGSVHRLSPFGATPICSSHANYSRILCGPTKSRGPEQRPYIACRFRSR